MNPQNPVLTGFASKSSFELVVGLNGMIWIKSENVKSTLLLTNLILSADRKNNWI